MKLFCLTLFGLIGVLNLMGSSRKSTPVGPAAPKAPSAPQFFNKMVLVGAMGIKHEQGEIFDYFLESGLTGLRRAFHYATDQLAEGVSSEQVRQNLRAAGLDQPGLRPGRQRRIADPHHRSAGDNALVTRIRISAVLRGPLSIPIAHMGIPNALPAIPRSRAGGGRPLLERLAIRPTG